MEKFTTIKSIKYRSSIFVNIILFLILCFAGLAKANDSGVSAKRVTATSAEKTSSSNIHVDEIVIKNSRSSSNDKESEDADKNTVFKLASDAEQKIDEWLKHQIIFAVGIVVAACLGIWGGVNELVRKGIEKQLDKLEKKREDAIDATSKVKYEIEVAQETLKEFRKKEKEINDKLIDFENLINQNEVEIGSLNDNFVNYFDEIESKTSAETYRLEQKNKVLRLIIEKIDSNKSFENEVIDNLIRDLESNDKKIKYEAAELLPQFVVGTDRITESFLKLLKNKPENTFESLLLSGLSELKGGSNSLNFLIEAVDDLVSPNLLAIVGALGMIGEKGKSKLSEEELKIAIDKLVSILNADLDKMTFSYESKITASDLRGAIALALSNYEDKASCATDKLLEFSRDQEPETRKNVAIAFGKIGSKSKEVMQELEKLKNDDFIEVKNAATIAIETIKNKI